MCKKINFQYLIKYNSGDYVNVEAICLSERKAEQLLPVIAQCICYQYYTEITETRKQCVELAKGRVYIETVPVLTDKQQTYHLYAVTEDLLK